MERTVFLLLGTNLGDRKKNLITARNEIERVVGSVVNASSIYRTAAWGKEDQPDFLNQALTVETSLSPEEVLDEILKIEIAMGRQRDVKWGARTIDIDILLYDDIVTVSPALTLPHPQLPNRRFALVPLSEIAGDAVHPVLRKTIHELLESCPDELAVHEYME